MDPKNRDVDSNTRSYMTRFGVDFRNEEFRKKYFEHRDFWGVVHGNGMLPDAVLYLLAFEFRPAQYRSVEETPAPQTKKAGKAA